MNKISLLLVALLAASARAQTFEARSNAGFHSVSLAAKKARLDIARRKKKEELPAMPAKVIPGGPLDKHRKDEVKLFASGWKEAMEALRDQKNCRKFFADHGDDYDKVIKALQNTEYQFEKLSSNVGAQTNGPDSVFINSDGIFVSATSGDIELNRKHYNLEEPKRVRAMVIFHELGHELGIFGVDAGPDLEPVNAAHSLDVIRNCLPGNGDATPKS